MNKKLMNSKKAMALSQVMILVIGIAGTRDIDKLKNFKLKRGLII